MNADGIHSVSLAEILRRLPRLGNPLSKETKKRS